MTVRRLLTIPISHFCEKARWALERAGLEYREERHVQGVNRVVSKRAGGHGTLPVLICEAGVLAESEAILRYADAHLPEARRLFPDQAAEVTTLCRELDAGLGPDGRRLMYAHMLPRKDFMLEFNDVGVPRWEDRMMRSLWPVVSYWGRRELEVHDDTLEQDRPRVLSAFDAIAARLEDGRPYLFGERFTAADLTFAALIAPLLLPARYGGVLPARDKFTAEIQSDIDALRARPAGKYALSIYDERPRPQH
jgi:glutathione S-transferase